MRYFVNDRPKDQLVIPVDADVTGLEASVTVLNPYGSPDQQPLGNFAFVDGDCVVTFDGWKFDTPGVYQFVVYGLNNLEGTEQRLATELVVAEGPRGWQTLDSAREQWADAPADDVTLYELLEVARQQVEEFAPFLSREDPVPVNYRRAQLMQAENIWTAGAVNSDGDFESGDYSRSAGFPLDWHVKQMLRPRRAVPRVQ